LVSKGFVYFFDEVVEVGGDGGVEWLQGCLEVDFWTTGSWEGIRSDMGVLSDLRWISTVRLRICLELPACRGYRPTDDAYTCWRCLPSVNLRSKVTNFLAHIRPVDEALAYPSKALDTRSRGPFIAQRVRVESSKRKSDRW
jgi:hypothetical protein